MTILSVAYPLAAVREETAGGAEQVLAMLDRALVRTGHRSIVVASEGSEAAGTLVATPRAEGTLDEAAKSAAQARHRQAIRSALERFPVDLVHLHGQDFAAYAPAGVPSIVTLHVPREWYGSLPAGPHYVFVSESQRRSWGLEYPVIENGVELDAYSTHVTRRGFALVLGRVSPEKGTHLALEAAIRADVPMLVAGEVYRYEAHERYFWQEVLPRLNGRARRFIGAAGLARKRRLLAAARCVVVPSQIAETSSLSAMEAFASGTPVVAFPAGALAEIVEDGRTGYLVRDVGEMAGAILRAGRVDPEVCRQAARTRFSAERTVREYLDLYESVRRTTWTTFAR